MHIKLREIPQGDSVVEATLLGPGSSDLDVRFDGGVRCRADIHRAGEQVQVRVSFSGNAELQCSRCLRDISVAVEGSFWLMHGGDLSVADDLDDDATLYYSKELEEFDVESAVRDEVLVAVPMKPLCSETCTGGDFALVEEDGQAPQPPEVSDEPDPRWAPLKNLKKRRS